MKKAGLEIKPSKCAVFAVSRSGNNWYVGKHDLPLVYMYKIIYYR